MKKILFFCFLLLSAGALAQQSAPVVNHYGPIFSIYKLDKQAEFPGGVELLYEYVGRNFRYPAAEKDVAVEMKVTFVIETDGTMTNVAIKKQAGYGIDEETKRVLLECPIQWQPGIVAGRPVRSTFDFPLVLKLYASKGLPPPTAKNIDTKAEYPGGEAALFKYVMTNYRIPEVDKDFNATVIITFNIDIDGSMGDFKIQKDPGYGMGDEAIRVIKGCKEKWMPATYKGNAVSSTYTLPLSINVKSSN
jgi:protein TonB